MFHSTEPDFANVPRITVTSPLNWILEFKHGGSDISGAALSIVSLDTPDTWNECNI
jgi:hypothetical protein